MYRVVKYDYHTKRNITLEKFDDKRYALDYLENYAIDYVAKQDGHQKIVDVNKSIVYKKDLPLTGKAVGHYIVRDPTDHVDKLEIWQKSKIINPGYLYNSTLVEYKKVFDVDLLDDKVNCADIEEPCFSDQYTSSWIDSVWQDFTSNFINTRTYNKLQESHNTGIYEKCKLSELRKEFAVEFSSIIPQPDAISPAQIELKKTRK